MRTLYRLAIVAVAIAVLFVIYSPLGIFYIVGGIICAAIVAFFPRSEENQDREQKEPLSPSKQTGSYVSSAWLGAKMDEQEERRRQAENKPR